MTLSTKHPRRPPRRARRAAALAAAAALLVCACGGPARPAATAARATTSAGGGLQLVTEPGDGMAPLFSLMASATTTLDLAMYELADPHAEAILADAAARHVTVRVLLDHNLAAAVNQPAFTYLAAHGVGVRWAPPGFAADHEKALAVDRDVAAVATGNLTSRYYPTTRDFAVIDRDPADVAAIEAVFDADFAGSPIAAPAGHNLLWSPGSQSPVVAFVSSAKRSVSVENEELADPAVVEALAADARRGVTVSITMTASARWAAAFSALTAAGADVHVDVGETPLYIHAKAAVVDAGTPAARADIGSQNDTVASLEHNRELGVIVTDPAVVASLAATLASDFAAARPWHR